VTYLLGTADVDPQHSGLDRSCAGLQQAANRHERGLRFKKHFDWFFSPHAHRLFRVPGVGHEGDKMFTSHEGRAVLFP
jgi:hypothetical protein